VDEYLSEKEQIERLRQWLAENGRSIATGLLLGLAAVAALWWWRPYRDHQLAEASGAYAELVDAADAGRRDKAIELAKKLDDYWRTPYGMQGALVLARMYMDTDEPEPAAEQLQKVVNEAHDDELVQIARLRLARVRLYQQQADEALKISATTIPASLHRSITRRAATSCTRSSATMKRALSTSRRSPRSIPAWRPLAHRDEAERRRSRSRRRTRPPTRLMRALIAGAFALAIALAGCAGRDKDEGEKPTELTDIEQTIRVDRVWSAKLGGDAENLRLGLAPASDGPNI
jgi:predicted negative regulator of RcsB-dependent stress response